MAIIKAIRVGDSLNGLNQAVTPIIEVFDCGGTIPKVGYLSPIGTCCSEETSYTFTPSSVIAHQDNPNIIYVVALTDDNGDYIWIDVKGGTETDTPTTTNADLSAKLDKVIQGCSCHDCSSTTLPTLDPVYNGVFPTAGSSTACYLITRKDNGSEQAIHTVATQYFNMLSTAPSFSARDNTAGTTTYLVKFNATNTAWLDGDSATSTIC